MCVPAVLGGVRSGVSSRRLGYVFVPKISLCFLKENPLFCEIRTRLNSWGRGLCPRVGLEEDFWEKSCLGRSGSNQTKIFSQQSKSSDWF